MPFLISAPGKEGKMGQVKGSTSFFFWLPPNWKQRRKRRQLPADRCSLKSRSDAMASQQRPSTPPVYLLAAVIHATFPARIGPGSGQSKSKLLSKAFWEM